MEELVGTEDSDTVVDEPALEELDVVDTEDTTV